MIGRPNRLQRVAEHLTFGLRIHYLLKVVILQFSTLYLTYLFAYPLSIPVTDDVLFQVGYSTVAIVFLVIVVVFIRNLCLRSLDPKFHRRTHIIASVGSYLFVSGVTVTLGYLLLIVLSTGSSSLTSADWVLGGFFMTASSSLLAVGYHERLESVDHPKQAEIRRLISEWNDTMVWAELDDSSFKKEKQRDEFEHYSEQLCDLLANAKTVDGKQLATDFEEWWNTFQRHEPLGKEIVINGQCDDGTKNERLQSEHRALMNIQRQLRTVANDHA